jgi:DNA-binding response OmpR family regulator
MDRRKPRPWSYLQRERPRLSRMQIGRISSKKTRIETTLTSVPIGSGSKRTVLVVDDDPGVRQLCRIHLEEAHFRVVEAADGHEALELVREDPPDLILLDILMPRLSGWQVAADLVNDRSTDQIPIIFLSVLTQRHDRLRAFRLGAVGYVPKPFDPATLAPTVTALLDEIDRGERSAVVAENIEKLQAELERAHRMQPPEDGRQ